MFDLSSIHSFGFPAEAQTLFVLKTVDELHKLSELASPILFVGEGSNTVFINDFPGTVVQIQLRGIHIEERECEYRLRVAAGENWHQLVTYLLERGIHGLENMALIPGTVGAAPIQNIGAYGKEFAQYCHTVSCFNLETSEQEVLPARECLFGYRDSIFKHKLKHSHLITEVTLELPKSWVAQNSYGELKELGTSPTAQQIYDKVVAIRSSKLPNHKLVGNAGSFFKNPVIPRELYLELKEKWPAMPCYSQGQAQVKVPAAWLLEQLGYKGVEFKGVACHQKQPLVLINNGDGTGEQLLALAKRIIADVDKHFSIRLNNEVRLISDGKSIEL